MPPTFLIHPQAVLDALEWSTITLTCSSRAIPPPLIRWEREGEAELPVEKQISLIPTNETTVSKSRNC